ncbi:MAG: site-specific integrase [Prevotella sp.]|nr:site-specific integrase [Prevotella sp.]
MCNMKTIREVSELWKQDKRMFVKSSTIAVYTLHLENHLLPKFGKKKTLQEQEVQDFVLECLRKGLSLKSVKDMLIVLKMVVKFGAKHGWLRYQDWNIKYPTEQKSKELEVLSISHQKKLMQYVTENFTFRNLGIYICLSTGMRIGEVCALRWGDIDVGTETIHVNRTIERIYIIEGDERRTELVIGTPKTKNSIREIPISKELMKLIRPLKKLMNDNYFVITNEAKPTEPRTYRNYYKQLLKQLGIPELKFHGLRHSFATRCIESKCDYKTVSVILGHANISTTLNLYVHPNMEQKKKCINQMFKALK